MNRGASPDGDRAVAPAASSPQAVSPVPASIPSVEWRDATDLKGVKWPVVGFAPGSYMGRCGTCNDPIVGCDKRAMQCLRCAINDLSLIYEAIDGAFRIRVWNDAKRRGLSDRGAMDEIHKARASAIEARRAGTEGSGAQHESAVPQADAQLPAGEP